MSIICRECSRVMSRVEFFGFGLGRFAKCCLPTFGSWVLNLIAARVGLTRGILDDLTAGVANGFGIECPQCKKLTCWDPGEVTEDDEQETAKRVLELEMSGDNKLV